MKVVLVITDDIAAGLQRAQIEAFLKRMRDAGLSAASAQGAMGDQDPVFRTDFFDRYPIQNTILISDSSDLAVEGTTRGYCCVGLDLAGGQSFPGVRVLAESFEALTPAFLGLTYAHHHKVPAIIHQTPAFVLRESIPEDFPALDEIFSQCEDTAFGNFSILEGKTAQQRKERFDAYARTVYRYYGYGMWTVVIGTSVAGWFGICPGDGAEEPYESPQLAFALGKMYRCQGYGRQICKAILRYAKEELGFAKLSLWTHQENRAAIALAHTLGFVRQPSENGQTGLIQFQTVL